ncbi:MAG: glycosyltransferase, partial [Actinomycetota bacterium]|nr:glycosyltransferase [Actinomycetota bacterium]
MLEPVQEDPQSAFLTVALIGPSHLQTGESRWHTAALAHSLEQAGHRVTLVSWSHPPPRSGRSSATEEAPAPGDPFTRTVRSLSWHRPDTWVRTGRRLRAVDLILLVHDGPAVVPAYLALLRAAGAGRTAHPAITPRSVLICHAAPPSRTGAGRIWRSMATQVDAVLAHSLETAASVRDLGASRVSSVALPPLSEQPSSRRAHRGPARLLAVDNARDDKGIDVLLEALREVPEVRLTIAGAMNGEHGQRIRRLAADPVLAERVVIRDEQLATEALAALAAEHDVLTLPRASGPSHDTPARDVVLGHIAGMAVITSDVHLLETTDVRRPGGAALAGDDRSLAGALRRLLDPGVLADLRAGAQPPDLSAAWATYIGTLESLAAPDVASDETAGETPDDPQQGWASVRSGPSPARGTTVAGATRAASELVGRARFGRARIGRARFGRILDGRAPAPRRAVVEMSRHDLPDWVLPTDVFAGRQDALDAMALVRELGLPRAGDASASWAALGALAAILRVSDDGRHSSVIVDESGSRSPMSRWARTLGFAPVALGLTRPPAAVSALDVDAGGLDVVTRLHPGGCDAGDVDDVIGEASWALRPGGLLVLT